MAALDFRRRVKWKFVVSSDTPKLKYIVCNADESEPGTFKDHLLMERNPHSAVRGMPDCVPCIGAKVGYIYIRGEFLHRVQQVLEQHSRPYKNGYVGKNGWGSAPWDCDIFIHRGAGAYEGWRGDGTPRIARGASARSRAEAAVSRDRGPSGSPTAVNNVENAVQRPADHAKRRRVVMRARPREERRTKAVLHQRARAEARRLRGVNEGDAAPADLRLRRRRPRRPRAESSDSGRLVGADSCCRIGFDIEASFDGVAKAGSLLGSAGVIVLDDTTCMVWLAESLLRFYRHEIVRRRARRAARARSGR